MLLGSKWKKPFDLSFLVATYNPSQSPNAFNSARKAGKRNVCRCRYVKVVSKKRFVRCLVKAFLIHLQVIENIKCDQSLLCKHGITLFGEIRLSNSTGPATCCMIAEALADRVLFFCTTVLR